MRAEPLWSNHLLTGHISPSCLWHSMAFQRQSNVGFGWVSQTTVPEKAQRCVSEKVCALFLNFTFFLVKSRQNSGVSICISMISCIFHHLAWLGLREISLNLAVSNYVVYDFKKWQKKTVSTSRLLEYLPQCKFCSPSLWGAQCSYRRYLIQLELGMGKEVYNLLCLG